MNTLVIITTYNRHEYLAELLPHVVGRGREVWVVDDGSDVPVKAPGASVHRRSHHGRLHYHKLVAWAFSRAQIMQADRIAMLPDDVLPAVEDPWREAESIWMEVRLRDQHALCLNPMVDRRGHIQQWESNVPVRVTDRAWLTGWNDLCIYANAATFLPAAQVNFKPPGPMHHGSGVGSQLSRALRKAGNLYQVDRTLWKHRAGPSVMCPDERIRVPL